MIDEEGNKTPKATAAFNQHEDTEFQNDFGAMVKDAYKELFGIYGDASWEQSFDKLISFFRNSDQTSDVVGRRQASTFQALAGLAGHGEVPAPQKQKAAKEPKAKNGKAAKTTTTQQQADLGKQGLGGNGKRDFGLTVRVEVNLPPAADQETYDRIFRSIRENLLNVK